MTQRLSLAGLPLAALLASCGAPPEPFARASVIESLDQAVGGPKAIAQPGDFLLENDHLRVAILSARNSLAPGLYGGSLVDADIRRSDPAHAGGQGKDQFAELFATVNLNVPHPDPEQPDSVSILADGSQGEAIIRVDGKAEPFLTLMSGLWAILGSPDMWFTTDYITRAGESWITMRTQVSFGHSGEGELPEAEPAGEHTGHLPLLDWGLETGMIMGEFYLSGGSVNVFSPGIGFDEEGAVYERMEAGENTFAEPFELDFLAGVADGVSYGLAASEGSLYVPLFTSSQTVAIGAGREGDGSRDRFPDGEAYTYERYFFVGHGDVGSIVDQLLEAREVPYGTVQGWVVEEAGGEPLSGADVFVYVPGAEAPWSHFKTDIHPDDRVADGSFTGRLPVGEWELSVHDRGRPPSERIKVEITENTERKVQLVAQRTAHLDFTVRDERGELLPSKISFFRLDGPPLRDPTLGDGFIAGSPEAVVFSLYGDGQVELAPGRYQAVASRGLEYELDLSAPFTVDAQQRARLDLQLIRSVDTTGWISADLHVHAVRSHDSGVSLAHRVRSMVAEGVEFFASTDHDYLVDYAPTIEALGVERWVQSAVGNEVTTVEVGHFLGFPLQQDFLGEAGADRDRVDWTDKDPQAILDDLRSLGADGGYDPVLFVGHPRDGILGYFDQFGFDPYGGTPGTAGEPGKPSISRPTLSLFNPLLEPKYITWDFHGLEVLGGKRQDMARTPTQPELNRLADGEDVRVYDLLTRTLDEQEDLEAGIYRLGYGVHGQIDDWFTLTNLGFRFTLLGNSDTHGLHSTEAGCPRNFIMSDTDDPLLLDDQAVADAVKAHRVVASYGPFIEMWIDGAPIGSEIVPEGEQISVSVDVQAPSWMQVDRVELYENGSLIHEWELDDYGEVLRLSETLRLSPTKDSWYTAIALGEGDLAPLFTPVEIPYIELQLVVTEALSGISAISNLLSPAPVMPRTYPIHPYAITNPIWVDLDGDGFDAPGLPDWLQAPVPREE